MPNIWKVIMNFKKGTGGIFSKKNISLSASLSVGHTLYSTLKSFPACNKWVLS